MSDSEAKKRYSALHLCATNDTNGNPRRLYLILNDEGNPVKALDEGYRGREVARLWAQERNVTLWNGPDIDVTPNEYKSWIRWQKAQA
jgi:hypothetical protein